MTILEELKEFLKNIFYVFCLFCVLTIFFFSFGLKKISVWGHFYTWPWPSQTSLAVIVFKKLEYDLLPAGVHLIVTNPLDAFISQVIIALLLAFILTLPFFLYKIIKYLSPALLAHENRAILKSLLPSTLLFFIGCLFAYYFIIPLTFRILFPYTTVIGATPFFSVNEFVHYVLSIMLVTGIIFLTPLLMALLSFFSVVPGSFWLAKWGQAFLFFLIFSAIITPDGSVVTVAMFFLPLSLLYLTGCLFAVNLNKE